MVLFQNSFSSVSDYTIIQHTRENQKHRNFAEGLYLLLLVRNQISFFSRIPTSNTILKRGSFWSIWNFFECSYHDIPRRVIHMQRLMLNTRCRTAAKLLSSRIRQADFLSMLISAANYRSVALKTTFTKNEFLKSFSVLMMWIYKYNI